MKNYSILFLSLSIWTCYGEKPVIILDLGGVVFKEPEFFVFDNLPAEIHAQFPHGFKAPRIFLRAFDFANQVAETNLKMPWLMGDVSGSEIARIIEEKIDLPDYSTFFISEQERLLIKYGAQIMFVPDLLAQWSQLNPEALEFVIQCKQKGIRLLILSNWDPVSFEFLKKKYPEFFTYFDEKDIFIPSTCGYAKPDKRVYECIIEKRGVSPKQCYFIDDSKKNIDAAIECNIKGIMHTNWPETAKQIEFI